MKKLLMVFILTSSCLFATPKVYDWVYINKLIDLDMNGNFLQVKFQADGGLSDGSKEKVELSGQMSSKNLTINTAQLVQVKTYRIKTSVLKTLVELTEDLLDNEED